MSRTVKNHFLARWGWILMVFVFWIHTGVVEAQEIRNFQREYSNAGSEFRGNLLTIGNALVTCENCNPDQSGIQNGGRTMVFVDADNDGSTTSSSRATLTLPAGSQIEYAALVWGARTTQASGNKTIQFKLPGSASYIPVTSDWAEYITGQYSNGDPYAAYADVTSLLQGLVGPNGDYWAADIDAVVGDGDSLGFYGGWALLVVYRNGGETYRTITVDAGYARLAGEDSIDIDLENLDTPLTGSYLFRLAAIVWEGDDGIPGDQLLVGPVPGVPSNVFDAQNPANNFWNSSISHLGAQFTDKDPDYVNQLGFDADTVEINDLSPGVSTIRTQFKTDGDHFFPQVLGTSVGLAIIKGAVYEDVDGDGNLADAVAVPNVTVTLYQDDGDGVPGAGDTWVASVTTTAQGEYSFQSINDGDYWVVVDSRTIAPSAGFNSGFDQDDVWAEQTYGAGDSWGGVLCDDDANSATPAATRSSAGPCFGGRNGNRSDDASSLPSAEHIARVGVHNSIVSGVDFGFSFNVVTNTNDQDDDAGANRSAQGSLRQFIQNANAAVGANAMRFTPAVPMNSGSWWTVAVESGNPLPAITDGATTLDGTAYDYADGTSIRDANMGSVFAPGPVGVSQIPLGDYAKPELEVNVNDASDGLTVSASNTEIARLALYNSQADPTTALIQVTSGSGNELRGAFLGARADGSDPQGDDRARFAVIVESGAEMDVVHNYVAHLDDTGVVLRGTGVVEENFIEHLGIVNVCGDGVSFEYGLPRNRSDVVVQRNYIRDVAAYGVESWRTPGAYSVLENTITDTGKGDRNGAYCGSSSSINTSERGGIRIFGSGSLVRGNVIHDVPGHAVVVAAIDSNTPSLQNTISQNSMHQNGGLSIDLDQGDGSGNPNGDGVTANDGQTSAQEQNNGLDYPVFTSVVFDDANLTLEGYIGTPTSKLQPGPGETWTIELYLADDDGNNDGEVILGDGQSVPHGEGKTYVVSATLESSDFSGGDFSKTIPASGLSYGDEVTAIAIDDDGNTSEFSANRTIGVLVSGRLYHDRDPNGARDGGDPALTPAELGTDLYVKRFADPDGDCSNGYSGPAEEVVMLDAGGGYAFAAVAPGSYCLVLSNNGDSNDTAAYNPSGAGWLYVNPPEGVLPLVAGTQPLAGNDFGLFHGARVRGAVFYDTGEDAGLANNAVQDGGEPGAPSVSVVASDGSNARTAMTDANGDYTIYVPVDWGSVSLYHDERTASGYNFPGTIQQAVDWADATAATDPDYTAFSQYLGAASGLAGQEVVDRNFGIVRDGEFRADQQGSATAPGVVTYTHSYKPGTQGTVTLTQQGGGYAYQVRVDEDCDSGFGAGEDWEAVSATEQPTFAVTDAWPREPDGSFRACTVEVRVLVPDGEPVGSLDLAQVFAELAWDHNPGVVEVDTVVDATTVRAQGGLVLEKQVRNVTQNVPTAGYATTVAARPGDVLEYCIDYVNGGTDPVQSVEIGDPVPFFADVVLDAYDTGAAADETLRWTQADGTVVLLTAAADADAGEGVAGLVTLRAETLLQPGTGGEVCYQVRVR